MGSGKSKIGLGRGFDALILTNFDGTLLSEDPSRIKNVLIERLQPNDQQPRHDFDQTALDELASSIKRFGILQPLIVTPGQGESYQIVAGERRWRAAKLAGLKEVPVVVRSSQELERLEIGLVENVQRVDLSPLEQAVSIARLHQEFNVPYEEIAKRIGKALPTVNNIVRLLQLPPEAQAALRDKHITEGHARAVLALKEYPEQQTELLHLIMQRGWSVRQAEAFVVACREGAKEKVAEKRTADKTPETERISQRLAAPVTIRRLAKGGRLMIRFKSDDDLERIVRLLG